MLPCAEVPSPPSGLPPSFSLVSSSLQHLGGGASAPRSPASVASRTSSSSSSSCPLGSVSATQPCHSPASAAEIFVQECSTLGRALSGGSAHDSSCVSPGRSAGPRSERSFNSVDADYPPANAYNYTTQQQVFNDELYGQIATAERRGAERASARFSAAHAAESREHATAAASLRAHLQQQGVAHRIAFTEAERTADAARLDAEHERKLRVDLEVRLQDHHADTAFLERQLQQERAAALAVAQHAQPAAAGQLARHAAAVQAADVELAALRGQLGVAHLDRSRLAGRMVAAERKAADACAAAEARVSESLVALRKQNASLTAAAVKQRAKSEGAAVLQRRPTMQRQRKFRLVASDTAAACGRLQDQVRALEQHALRFAPHAPSPPDAPPAPVPQSRANRNRARKRSEVAAAAAAAAAAMPAEEMPAAVHAAPALDAHAPLPAEAVQQIVAAVVAALPAVPAAVPRIASRAIGIFKSKSLRRGKVIKQMADDWRAGLPPPPPDTHYQPRRDARGQKRHRTNNRTRQPALPYNHKHRRCGERQLEHGPSRGGGGGGNGGVRRR